MGKGKYVRKTMYAGPIIRRYNYVSGRIGKRDRNRKREKPTAEKVLKWQDKRAEEMCMGLLWTNFRPGDLFMTLSYPPKTWKDSESVRRDIKKFIHRLRKLYKKLGKELKYILSVGRGKRGRIHFHIILPHVDSIKVERIWQDVAGTDDCPYPYCNTKHLVSNYDWKKLAEYMVKNGLETFRSDDPIYNRRYVTSRNLKKPRIKRETMNASHWLKTPKPIKGYRLDKESVWNGEGLTGFPYQSYTLVRLNI